METRQGNQTGKQEKAAIKEDAIGRKDRNAIYGDETGR